MRFLDRVFATPEENLACDEALLDVCEEDVDSEVLRVWQPVQRFVVLGYTNAASKEVHLAACKAVGVPIYRRTSGGGTIVQLPGCLNYALILRIDRHPALAGIDGTNRLVLDRLAAALSSLTPAPVMVRGQTDLCVGDRKVAGNAQRRRMRALLFHGTLLLHADIPEIERLLPFPSTQPEYRMDRAHSAFLANLALDPEAVIAVLRTAWHAHLPYTHPVEKRLDTLVHTKYRTRDWIMRR
jgi:lipoate-protein ligase A